MYVYNVMYNNNNSQLEGTHRVQTHAALLYPNLNSNPWPLTFQSQNHVASRISQGISYVYPRYILYPTTFADKQLNKQLNKQTNKQTDSKILPTSIDIVGVGN